MKEIKYDIKILEKLLKYEIENARIAQDWVNNSIIRKFRDERIDSEINAIGRNTAVIRYIAALIENNGILDKTFCGKGVIGLNMINYSTAAGMDSSWWTKGT